MRLRAYVRPKPSITSNPHRRSRIPARDSAILIGGETFMETPMIEAGVVYLLLSLCDRNGTCALQLEQLPSTTTIAECRNAEPAVRALAARRGQRVESYRCVATPR